MSDYRTAGSLVLMACVAGVLDPSRVRRVDQANGLGYCPSMSLTPEQRAALSTIGRMGGQAKSAAKAAAVRLNGQRGASKQRATIARKKQNNQLTS